MDDLLAHRQWVRSLARRLAADEARADDLEQETWLAAVEHPPRDPRSIRGWLGTVVRNLHRNSLRGDVRRERRETATRLREPEPGAPEIVAEAETQHLLVSEVLALDEPYRSTVLLRWYEDLTPTEIAARQGVPVDTVKTRLRRAVDRLRERMDARFDGDRKAWCLLALGGGDRAGPGIGSAAGTKAALTGVAGGMAMGAGAKAAAVGAVMLVLCAALLWTRTDGGRRAARAPDVATSPSSGGGSSGRSGRSAVEESSPAPRAPAAGRFDRDLDLHGVVVRADGSPVAGAQVRAVDYPWRRTMTMNTAALFEGTPGPETTSDAAGEFAIRLRRGEARVLRASAEGLATREMGPFQAGERVKIVMTRAVALHVSVRDEAGAPVAGAALWLVGFGNRGDQPWVNARGTTDAAGKHDFDGLPGGAQVMVAPEAGAGDWGMQPTTLPAEGDATMDIVSPTGRTLRGRVFDAVSLAPVVGAQVGLGKAVLCATTTDGGGRFEVRGFSGKGERSLAVAAPGYPRAAVAVPPGDEPIDVALRRGFEAVGRVVDADGAALPGVRVAVEASQRGPAGEETSCGYATTGADGRFRIADLSRALPHALSAFTDGRGRVRLLVMPPLAEAEATDVGDVRLAAPRAIEGVVLKPDGSPWPGVEVQLSGPNVPQFSAISELGARETRRSDDLGRFRFADLSAGTYSVELRLPQQMPQSVGVTLPADRDVTDLMLPPRPSADAIAVQVVDDVGTPIPHTIVIGRGSLRAEVRVETDDAGRGKLRSPPDGKITRLLVGAPIPGAYLVSREVPVQPGVAEQRLVVERGVYVPVQVIDADGRPLVGARLHVEPPERGTVWGGTDENGRAKAIVPREGEVSIVFNGTVFSGLGDEFKMTDALLEARQDGVTAQSGEVVLRCRRVETGKSATVRVLAADGSPMAGVDVAVAGGGANFRRMAKTDADGRARLDDLPGRALRASAWGRLDAIFPDAVTFSPNGQEVVLKCPQGVTVTGSAVWSNGGAVEGASAIASWGSSGNFFTTVDRDGRFTVQVPAGEPGPFRLQIDARNGAGFVRAEREFTAADRDVRVEVKR